MDLLGPPGHGLGLERPERDAVDRHECGHQWGGRDCAAVSAEDELGVHGEDFNRFRRR
jgi:hypothetical protein